MVSLTINKSSSIFTNMIFRELINKKHLNAMIKKYSNNPSIHENLMKIKKKMKKENYLKVKYTRKIKYGRLIADGGYIYLKSQIRNLLVDDKYVDIDIVNCWCSILSQLCNSNNIMCEKLTSYVNNREHILDKIINEEDCDRDEAKTKIFQCMMSDEYKTKNKFLLELRDETSKSADFIISFNKNLVKDVEKYNKKTNKTSNIKYSVLSYVFGQYELQIIESVYNYLKEKDLIDENNFATYSYDGIMIKGDKNVIIKHIEKLEKRILKDTEFNIKLKMKSMKDKIKVIKSSLKDEFIKVKVDTLSKEYYKDNYITDLEAQQDFIPAFFEELSELSYPDNFNFMSEYFDRHFMFIVKCGLFTKKSIEYIYENKEKYPERYYTKINLEEYTIYGLKEYVFIDDDDKEQMFLKKYKSKKFNKIIFDPDNNNAANFNLFDGFGYKMIDCEITEEDKKLFNTYLDYIREYFCDNNKKMFDNFMSFLANIIQFPTVKIDQSYILYSNMKGVGKSKLGGMLRKVFGLNHTFFGDVNKILGDGFDECIEHKLMIFIDEYKSGNGSGSDKFQELKSKISADRVFINKKYKSVEEHKDYCRYIIATDSTKYIKLERNHRRFNILHVRKIDDKKLLRKINIINGAKSLTIAKMFGEYLYDYDIKYGMYDIDEWIENRVQPDCHDEFLTTSSFEDFIVKLYKKDIDKNDYYYDEIAHIYKKDYLLRISNSKMYRIIYGGEGKYRMKESTFTKEINKEQYRPWIKTVTNHNISCYKINLQVLHKYLTKNRLLHTANDKEYKNYWTMKDIQEEHPDSDAETDDEDE